MIEFTTAGQWYDTDMNSHPYRFLDIDPESSYRQLRVAGRRIFARTLYSLTLGGEDAQTPENVAADYGLPVEAVLEAIAYCESNPREIAEDFAKDEERARERGLSVQTDGSVPGRLEKHQYEDLSR